MDRLAFKPDTRYTLACKDAKGRGRPLDVYVHRLYGKFMVARKTGAGGPVRRTDCDALERIVSAREVVPADRFFLPAGVLDEASSRDRSAMQRCASAPGQGT